MTAPFVSSVVETPKPQAMSLDFARDERMGGGRDNMSTPSITQTAHSRWKSR